MRFRKEETDIGLQGLVLIHVQGIPGPRMDSDDSLSSPECMGVYWMSSERIVGAHTYYATALHMMMVMILRLPQLMSLSQSN